MAKAADKLASLYSEETQLAIQRGQLSRQIDTLTRQLEKIDRRLELISTIRQGSELGAAALMERAKDG